MGHEKGDYQYCLPNDHCNCGQSTNDVYPTTIRLAIIHMNKSLIAALTGLISAFRYKGDEFKDCIKMGRTQLQDAVPMTSGQEFNAYANNLEEEILNLERNVKLLLEADGRGLRIGYRPGGGHPRHRRLRQLLVGPEATGREAVEDL